MPQTSRMSLCQGGCGHSGGSWEEENGLHQSPVCLRAMSANLETSYFECPEPLDMEEDTVLICGRLLSLVSPGHSASGLN